MYPLINPGLLHRWLETVVCCSTRKPGEIKVMINQMLGIMWHNWSKAGVFLKIDKAGTLESQPFGNWIKIFPK